MAENRFDSEKDMTAITYGCSYTVEVKTHVPILKYNAMCQPNSQWNKLDNCDILFYVKIPLSLSQTIDIFEVVKDDYHVYENFGPKKQLVRMYPIKSMVLKKTISDMDIIKKMYDLSPSIFKN